MDPEKIAETNYEFPYENQYFPGPIIDGEHFINPRFLQDLMPLGEYPENDNKFKVKFLFPTL